MTRFFRLFMCNWGFSITFSSCLVVLFIKELTPYWMTSVIACVSFFFVIGVLCPVGFAYRQLSGLKITSKKLTEERSKILDSCVSLLNYYTQIFVFVSNLSNNQDLENEGDEDSDDMDLDGLLKDIIDFQIEKLEEFRSEDIVPKFWKKHNRKYILAVALCCLVFTVNVLLYAIYKTKSQAVPDPALAPIPSQIPFGLLLKDDLALFVRFVH